MSMCKWVLVCNFSVHFRFQRGHNQSGADQNTSGHNMGTAVGVGVCVGYSCVCTCVGYSCGCVCVVGGYSCVCVCMVGRNSLRGSLADRALLTIRSIDIYK